LRSSGVVLCLCLALARAAAAPPDPQAVELAKRRYAEGEKRFAAGDLPGAAEAFKEAFRLTRNPILLYNLGFVYDKQGDATLALLYYEKFLADAPDTPRLKEKRIEVTARVAALKAATETPVPVPVPEPPPPNLGHDVIAEAPPAKPVDVTARPPAATGWSYTLFYRDGEEGIYQSVPLKQRLGELVARIPSAVTRARTIHYYLEARTADGRLVAASGKANAPNVIYIDPAAPPHYYRDETSDTMTPPPAPDAPPAPPPVAPPRDRGASALGIGKWVATGGALALIGTGVALYFVAADHANALEEEAFRSRTECATPPCRVYTDARKDLEAKGKRFQTWGHVAVAAGGAALVGAAILWYFDLRGPREPAVVGPVVGPGVVGASATVRF